MSVEVELSIKSEGWDFMLRDPEGGPFYEVRLQLLERSKINYENISPEMLKNLSSGKGLKFDRLIFATVSESDIVDPWRTSVAIDSGDLTCEENWLFIAHEVLNQYFEFKADPVDPRPSRFQRPWVI